MSRYDDALLSELTDDDWKGESVTGGASSELEPCVGSGSKAVAGGPFAAFVAVWSACLSVGT